MDHYNRQYVMPFTGERMVPELADWYIYWEHVYRYAFACKLVKGLNVLDVASGEGYGTYALSRVSKTVIGVDINGESVSHAKQKYGLDFREGSAEVIPVESNSVDAVVSFETIEHLSRPAKFIEEAFRVLRPGGIFIISTPNKDVFLKGEKKNEFHCSEMSKTEFEAVLGQHFKITNFYGQRYPTCWLDDLQKVLGAISNRFGYSVRCWMEKRLRDRFLSEKDAFELKDRQEVLDSIPSLSSPFEKLWNPFAIKGLDKQKRGRPMYFIAVGTKQTRTN